MVILRLLVLIVCKSADSLQKLGPKSDEDKVDHGYMTYKHHERIKNQEKK